MDKKYLQELEAEAIYILREAAACFGKSTILFSGGKDSQVLTHLAVKAFYPLSPPFTLMLVDTGHNFPETMDFINSRVSELKIPFVSASVETALQEGWLQDVQGPLPSRNRLQSAVLMKAIHEFNFRAVIGGGRRDEDKARAKERLFSIRDKDGVWPAERQGPELWDLANTLLEPTQHMRVFPLSNWTELDVWHYIQLENISLPKIYFSHLRQCFSYQGQLLAYSENFEIPKELRPQLEQVRCRTVGDMTCTGLIRSEAMTVQDVIAEIEISNTSERGLRIDDQFSDASMEERKKEGYF